MNRILLKNVCSTLLFLTLSTLLIGVLVFLFCELFYYLGNLAKITIVSYSKISLVILPILLWLSTMICRKYAKNASGSNLDHISDAIRKLKLAPHDYQLISDLLSFRIILVAVISSLIATFAGGSLGREGISIYIATTLFVVLANILRKYLPQIALECWIYVGYAVGFSVAFNAPIAGLIYITEKLIKNQSKNFKLAFLLSLFAILLLIKPLSYLPLVYKIPNIDFQYSFADLKIYLLIAILSALTLVIFRYSLNFGYKKISNLNGISWHISVFSLAFLIILIADLFGVYVIGGGIKTVNDAFNFQGTLITSDDFFARLITTILTFIIGCSGGTVAPSIALGASLSSTINQATNIDLMSMMLVGMTCFLSPLLATPITSAVVIIESTRQDFQLILIMIPLSLVAFFFYLYLNKMIEVCKNKLAK